MISCLKCVVHCIRVSSCAVQCSHRHFDPAHRHLAPSHRHFAQSRRHLSPSHRHFAQPRRHLAPKHGHLTPAHRNLAPVHRHLAPRHTHVALVHRDLVPSHSHLAHRHLDLAHRHLRSDGCWFSKQIRKLNIINKSTLGHQYQFYCLFTLSLSHLSIELAMGWPRLDFGLFYHILFAFCLENIHPSDPKVIFPL